MPERGRFIAGEVGVMSEARRLEVRGPCFHRAEDTLVKRRGAVARKRFLDRSARELVAEHHGIAAGDQRSGGDALIEGSSRFGISAEKPPFGAGRYDGYE